ncbi:MAG: 3D domain-containing protein [Lachnospiraceae bacterium]
MKIKRLWANLILMTVILLGSSSISYATPEAGYFDEMDGNTIVGWGWDSNTPNTAVPVQVTVTNQDTGEQVLNTSLTAATYRDDLAENQIGNGNHGFRLRLDYDSLTDGVYLIEGWVDDKKISNTQTITKGQITEKTEETVADASDGTGTSLGTFRTTAYCPCYQCSEGWGRQTSTGATAKSNHTIAVDPNVIPYGTKVMINGVVYTAEDRGGGVKGQHIDIFYDTHSQTKQHGTRTAEVFLVQ